MSAFRKYKGFLGQHDLFLFLEVMSLVFSERNTIDNKDNTTHCITEYENESQKQQKGNVADSFL